MSRSITGVSADSADWIEASYSGRERLRRALWFVSSDLVDGARGDLESLERVWFFPWAEAALELELAFACALSGLHRACVDHHRRALELVVVGAYFVSDHIDASNGSAWYAGDLQTPPFTRALDKLARTGFCGIVDNATGWLSSVKQHYWRLSDVVHVRGEAHSLRQLQGSLGIISGMPLPMFSAPALEKTLMLYEETCAHIAAALAVANPALLVGMPLSEKYGEDPPIGFFEEAQSLDLREMISERFRGAFVSAAENDPTVKSIKAYMESRPDITEDEIRRQIEAF